jgi:DNA-binding transcriptional LysR family regulator
MINLDMDVLRTLATGMELGSFARAAERLGRSQSAISLQLKKLEEQVGRPLLRKEGRGLALTDAGDVILTYAKRILELNDEALAAAGAIDVAGIVRLGMPQGIAETWLMPVLARFARSHPAVHVEVRVDRSAVVLEQLAQGRLDLALVFERVGAAGPGEVVAELPMAWIGRRGFSATDLLMSGAPLSLALFDAPCVFREMAINALEGAGIAWRLAFTSPSLAGLWAAVAAGLGVTIRTTESLPEDLAILPEGCGLPALPKSALRLQLVGAVPSPAALRLKEILLETLRASLAPAGGLRARAG